MNVVPNPDFRSPNKKYWHTRVKILIFKKFQGAQIAIFFVKIGMKLPFTIKNKLKNTKLKFEFKNYFIFTPEKVRFWFLKKNPPKNIFLPLLALIQL